MGEVLANSYSYYFRKIVQKTEVARAVRSKGEEEKSKVNFSLSPAPTRAVVCRPLPPTATAADTEEVDSVCLLLLLLLLVGCGGWFTAVPIPVGSSYY